MNDTTLIDLGFEYGPQKATQAKLQPWLYFSIVKDGIAVESGRTVNLTDEQIEAINFIVAPIIQDALAMQTGEFDAAPQ